ncbi:type 2 lantipeptide synthetase LanM [Sphaerospermopsis sp. FACHB-1094]|uniref:type 2 lanthipeptide synthetase LanM family protein n=1 Tax=Sphaerospermopsis sp. FACHB-1094 TaxID=2692861 RepID=UPI0016823D5E|nr:type 2 lanthipeptide synthetase LanM family protein [Sphaerospermopsis sp. FACHB-1094]MBD2131438.1 type 2 lantipeptide synthetase LanM [Sphaerospermopsis sp. FACHB-1094]
MKLSQTDLAAIVGKSSTIAERLKSNLLTNQDSINNSTVNSRLQHWCRVAAKGDTKKFAKRLAWDGLDINTVCLALDTNFSLGDAPLPDWAETLASVMEKMGTITLEISQYPFLDPHRPIAFETLFIPFVEVAKEKLIAQANSQYQLLEPQVQVVLERHLLKKLASVGGQTLYAEFVTFRNFRRSGLVSSLVKSSGGPSRKLYQKFIEELLQDNLLSFFHKYSVLARLLSTITNFWVEAMSEFLNRLGKDWEEIQKTFQPEIELGQIVKLNLDIADDHNRGRCVMILEFSSGLKLVYKPRSLGLESGYFQLLDWLNQQGSPLPFQVIKVIDRYHYGWMEYVAQLPCENQAAVKRYYQRAGFLLCLLYALKGNDCHYENLIASGEHPILIDLETLLQPQIREMEDQGDDGELQALFNQLLDSSVLSIGLLPNWELGADGQTLFDVSGLGGEGGQQMPYQLLSWQNINTDPMSLGQQYGKLPPQANLPSLDGAIRSPNSYTEEIVTGFRLMYQLLLERQDNILAPDGPLASLSHQLLRCLFRNTRLYGVILKNALSPQYLQNGVDFSIELDILSRAFLVCDQKPYCWELLGREHEALTQLDIPYLSAYANSQDMIISPEQNISGAFREPSYNSVIAHIQRLNPEDMEQQISIIRGSLYALVANELDTTAVDSNNWPDFNDFTPLSQEAMLQQAMAIATDLRQKAIYTADGIPRWTGLEYLPKTGKLQLQLIDFGLEGGCGIALFLAALEKVTGGAGYRDLALSALQLLSRMINNSKAYQQLKMSVDLGAMGGFGSMLYTLVKVSQFLDAPSLLEDAKQLASLLTPADISSDRNLDIAMGTAGALLGLLTLYQATGDAAVLEMAMICGQHLLAHRCISATGYKTWQGMGLEKPLTGFSHGAAGIAYSLLRLYGATSDPAYLAAAQEAIAYETSVFSPNANNWPDFRPFVLKDNQPSFMSSWCHGAPGIGLARLGSLPYLDTPEIRRDIDIALQTTEKYSWQGVDHLCCGNLGRVDILLEASRRLSRPELMAQVPQQIAWVVDRAKQTGGFHLFHKVTQGVYHPGFFRGVAGIGYELLRLAKPDVLPSVLLWD